MLTHIDLFSGIGGFALAARWAGIETVQFVEIDPFCQKVLQKNFLGVPIHDDIKTFKWIGTRPFILTGGFPCQDLSYAGKRKGLREGTRSGLWIEYANIIGTIRPHYVLVENVTGLLDNHALGRVLGDLAEIGYDAEWDLFYATQFGIPQKRPRIFLVAYPSSSCQQTILYKNTINAQSNFTGMDGKSSRLPNTNNKNYRTCSMPLLGNGTWTTIPYRERSGNNDGIPNRVDRLKSLGNAIVPQIAYQIFKAIIEVEQTRIGQGEG